MSPCSPLEACECIYAAYKMEGPVYIRLGMNGEKEIYSSEYTFQVGKCVEVCKGLDAVMFVTGNIVTEAMEAAAELEKQCGIGLKVVNVHTLKPISNKEILQQIENRSMVFTLEEHNIYGGLGSILADCLVEEHWPGKLVKIGIKDCFAKGYGTVSEVREKNGVGKKNIVEVVRGILEKKV